MSASDHIFEQHQGLIAALRAGELGAPESLHERVLAAGPGTKRQRTPMSRRRKLIVLVPVAAGLAVGAALIHGAFSSNPTSVPSATALGPLRAPARPGAANLSLTAKTAHRAATQGEALVAHGNFSTPTAANSYAPLKREFPSKSINGTAATADAAGIFSGNVANGAYAGSSALTSDSLGGNNPVTLPKGRLVHADASLQVVVASHDALTNATNKATQIVTGLGGYAQSVQYQASHKGDGNAYLDLRVPVGKVQTAMGKLAGLGKLYSQEVATQDLQQQFTKQTSTIGRLQRAIAIYQQALASGSVVGSQRVEVQIRLANAEHQLNAQRKARSQTVASAATASIQLQLTTNQQAFAAGPHKQGRLGRLLGNAGDFLGLEGIIVLYALIVAGPIALILWLGWAVRRERRRRDEKALLAST